MQNRVAIYLTSYVFFIGIVILLCLNAPVLFMDSDTAWHFAAGDLIRATGNLIPPNTWSFTAPSHPWVNISWLWDIWMSYLYAHMGWVGPIMFHSITIAVTLVLLYQACLLCSGNGIASFFSVLFVLLSIMLHMRSFWASNALLALLFYLALLVQHRGWSIYWWYAMPILMPLWVNVHGAFIIAFIMLGAYGLQALIERNWRVTAHLTAVGLLSIVGCAVSPYSLLETYSVVFSMVNKFSFYFTNEFQPTIVTWGFLLGAMFIPIFGYYSIRYQSKATMAENILAFGFLLLGLTCLRYWNFFYLFACPLLARYIAQGMGDSKHRNTGIPQLKQFVNSLYQWIFVRHTKAVYVFTSLVWALSLIALFTPASARIFKLENFQPYAAYEPAIAFAQKHYPDHRFVNDYGMGAHILYLSHGKLPVFIDGRVETAYPDAVIKDFYHLWMGMEGWEKLIDKYQINGAIVYSTTYAGSELRRLFIHKPDWKEVFHDDDVTIYIRQIAGDV